MVGIYRLSISVALVDLGVDLGIASLCTAVLALPLTPRPGVSHASTVKHFATFPLLTTCEWARRARALLRNRSHVRPYWPGTSHHDTRPEVTHPNPRIPALLQVNGVFSEL